MKKTQNDSREIFDKANLVAEVLGNMELKIAGSKERASGFKYIFRKKDMVIQSFYSPETENPDKVKSTEVAIQSREVKNRFVYHAILKETQEPDFEVEAYEEGEWKGALAQAYILACEKEGTNKANKFGD